MEIFNLILLLPFSAVWLLLIYRLVKKNKTWTYNLWAHVWLYVSYYFIPTMILIIDLSGGNFDHGFKDIVLKHPTYTNTFTILSSTLFMFTYAFFAEINLKTFKFYNYSLRIESSHFSLIKVFIFSSLLISLFSIIGYTNAQGGLKQVLYNARNINFSGVKGISSMLLRFVPFSIFILLILPFIKSKFTKLIIAPFALLIFILYTLIDQQRQNMLFLVLIPLFGFLIYKNKFITKKLLITFAIIIISFPVVHFLNKAHTLDKKSYEIYRNDITASKYLKEFSFPAISLYLSQNQKYDKLILDDLWTGFFGNWLPNSWIEDSRPANSLNSYFFLNKKSRDVPPGIIANAYYHLGLFGIIIFAAGFGLFINITEKLISPLVKNDKRYAYIYSFFFWAFFAYIRTGVLGFSLYKPFFMFLLIFIILSHYLNYNKAKKNTQSISK